MTQQLLLKKLIEDNLRTTKLVDGLGGLGLCSLEYYSKHHIDILQHHLGIILSEQEKDRYYTMTEQVDEISIEHHDSLENLTDRIYTYIIGVKNSK
jgi:hypothetical protein